MDTKRGWTMSVSKRSPRSELPMLERGALHGDQVYPTLDPDFGHWFAGFVDGEGCFYIHPLGCRFILVMRADDEDVLRTIQETLGIGRISYRFRNLGADGAHPQFRLEVARKADCAWLTTVFDQFPLRSRKAADYAVWREAALLHVETGTPTSVVPFIAELRAARRFVGATEREL